MPLALLLQEVGSTLNAGTRRLAGWSQLVELEELLIERARSAFLVRWFGSRLPLTGLNLSAVIVNIDDLNARYRAAQRSVPSSERGPNLLEPFAGLAGMLVGVMLSPVGAVTGVSLLFRFAGFSVKTFLAALLWLALPTLVILVPRAGLLLGILLGGGSAAFGLSGGIADRADQRGVFDFMGSLARLLNSASELIAQMVGPRSEVRNPLLRRVLELMDRFADLVPQALGALAFVVTRVAPLLPQLAAFAVAVLELVDAVKVVFLEIVTGFQARVQSLLHGALSPQRFMRRLVELIMTGATALVAPGGALLSALSQLLPQLTRTWSAIEGAFSRYLTAQGARIRRTFRESFLMVVVNALKEQITVARTEFARPAAGGSSSGGGSGTPGLALGAFPSFPTAPTLPDLPDASALLTAAGAATTPTLSVATIEGAAAGALAARGGPRFVLSDESRLAVDRARRPRSVFPAERRTLDRSLGVTPTAALALTRTQLTELGTGLRVVVGRIMPPELRVYADELDDLLTSVSDFIFDERTPERTLPVQDLRDNGRLRATVGKLRIHVVGGTSGDAGEFHNLLTPRLQALELWAEGGS